MWHDLSQQGRLSCSPLVNTKHKSIKDFARVRRNRRSENAFLLVPVPMHARKTTDAGNTKNTPGEEEGSEAFEGVDEILCRLAQAHPTQMPKRWELITQKLNRIMKKKRISTQPMKTLFSEEGLCIPQCWVAEKAQAEEERARARAAKAAEKAKPASGITNIFGKKKKADQKEPKKDPAAGVDGSDEAGESDTKLESDDEEGGTAGARAVEGDGAESGYRYRPLSKYEVFSCMRGVHDRAGADVVAAEDAVEKMESARKMVDALYEKLPAQALKEMSQQNRINAGLKQERLVYGEIHIAEFLEVIVKQITPASENPCPPYLRSSSSMRLRHVCSLSRSAFCIAAHVFPHAKVH